MLPEALTDIFFFLSHTDGTTKPVEPRSSELDPPAPNDSSNSSASSTPDDNTSRGGHKTDTGKGEGQDGLLSAGKGDSKGTSQPTVTKTIVFSPRIQFHETWPSGEYDRRGEAATCNRLTPLLAQQIKEELNSFKMVGFCTARGSFLRATITDQV